MITSLQRRRRATSEPIKCQACTKPFAKRDRLWTHKRKNAATKCASHCPVVSSSTDEYSPIEDGSKEQDASSDTESSTRAPEPHAKMDYPEQVPSELGCRSTTKKLSAAIAATKEETSAATSTTGKELAAYESHPSLCPRDLTAVTVFIEGPEITRQSKKSVSCNSYSPCKPQPIENKVVHKVSREHLLLYTIPFA